LEKTKQKMATLPGFPNQPQRKLKTHFPKKKTKKEKQHFFLFGCLFFIYYYFHIFFIRPENLKTHVFPSKIFLNFLYYFMAELSF
jgi:hypothetical protein